MVTPEGKMKAILGAAGESWKNPRREDGPWGTRYVNRSNPSPTYLNDLFRLAEKLQFMDIHFEIHSEGCWIGTVNANTPAEALLNALYEAIE